MVIDLLNPEDRIKTGERKTFLQDSLDMIPLGLLYIGTMLQNSGHDVQIIDYNIGDRISEDDRLNKTLFRKPGLIGITTATSSYNNAIAIIKRLKENINWNTVIVWGGPHVTYLPEDPIMLGCADLVVRGEAEYIMREIAEKLERNKSMKDLYRIPGVSFKENGKIHHNPPSILRISDLDSLPFPDRNLIETEEYKNPTTIIGSRGCPAKCQFCSSASWGSPFIRSSENIILEITQLINEYGYNNFPFVDNTFVVNKNKTLELLRKLENVDGDLSFSAEVNLSFLDDEIIEHFSNANLRYVQFGIESGNESILKAIGKNIKLKDVQKKIELCLNKNIHAICSFIIGHPDDTKETIKDTLEFAIMLKKIGVSIAVSILTPYPGSEVFKNKERLGVKISDWNYDNWGLPYHSVMETSNLSSKLMKSLYLEALNKINSV